MKKQIPLIIITFVFLIGLGILFYPAVSEYINRKSQTKAMNDYTQIVSGLDKNDYEDILERAHQMNEDMAEGKNRYDSKEEWDKAYQAALRVGTSDVMGYVEIPKINVKLPIYHTTGSSVLQSGIGHLQGTSLPIGGKSTHTVLSGHRGLPSAKLLSDLEEMESGDIFTIHVLDRLLTYQVDQIEVVTSEDVDSLKIVRGQDYVTLITCTPYGINTHRLLVRGHRIENLPENRGVSVVVPNYEMRIDMYLIVSVSAGLIMALVFVILLLYNRRYKQKNKL